MKYEKPQVTLEKYTLNVPVMTEDVTSKIGPVTPTKGPVIEANEAVQELQDAFGSIFDFSN